MEETGSHRKKCPAHSNNCQEAKEEIRNTNVWILDSGASEHMTFDRSKFVSCLDYVRGVELANFARIEAAGIGSIAFNVGEGDEKRNITLSEVLYVPKLGVNLLSIGQFVDDGLSVEFAMGKVKLIDEKGDTFLSGEKKGRLFVIQENITIQENDAVQEILAIQENNAVQENAAVQEHDAVQENIAIQENNVIRENKITVASVERKVLNAVKTLQEPKGVSLPELKKFLQDEKKMDVQQYIAEIKLALKDYTDRGIMSRDGGLYKVKKETVPRGKSHSKTGERRSSRRRSRSSLRRSGSRRRRRSKGGTRRRSGRSKRRSRCSRRTPRSRRTAAA